LALLAFVSLGPGERWQVGFPPAVKPETHPDQGKDQIPAEPKQLDAFEKEEQSKDHAKQRDPQPGSPRPA
jgi:hypothetical protein